MSLGKLMLAGDIFLLRIVIYEGRFSIEAPFVLTIYVSRNDLGKRLNEPLSQLQIMEYIN